MHSTFSPSAGWTSPVGLAAIPPDLARADAYGRTLVMGRRPGRTFDEPAPLAAACFDPSIGWSETTPLPTRNAVMARRIAFGVRYNGDAVAVWAQSPENGCELCGEELWSTRFSDREGWAVPQRIRGTPDGPWFSLDIAVNASGLAVGVWSTLSGTVMAARADPVSGWDEPFAAFHDPERPRDIRVAIDADGEALVVWTTENGRAVRGARIASSGAEDAVRLGEGRGIPLVVSDRLGNGVVVWRDASAGSLMACPYRADTSWGETVPIGDAAGADETLGWPSPALFDVTLDGQGRVHALWLAKRDDHWEVWTRRYSED